MHPRRPERHSSRGWADCAWPWLRLSIWIAPLVGFESAPAEEPSTAPRPAMRTLAAPDTPGAGGPPAPRDLAAGKRDFRRRFRESFSHADSAAGAVAAAEALLAAAPEEDDRTMKWLMLDEARRLGESAGQAAIVSRAVTLAGADYDFDALDVELRSLARIPLRALDSRRAARLAEAAESISIRAETDGRIDAAASATTLAYRAWQRAGNGESARRAAARQAELEGR